MSWITKQFDCSVAIMLSVLLFVVESAIIFFCMPDTGSISPTHSESAPKSSKPITTFKPRLQFHGNIGVFLSPLGSSTSSATPHDPTSFALLLYLGYLLAVDSLNKGFGAVKVAAPLR